MMTLNELVSKTNETWQDEVESLRNAKRPIQMQDHLQAYRELGLGSHERELEFNVKCQMASDAGLVQVTVEQTIRMMTGDWKTKIHRGERKEHYARDFYHPVINAGIRGYHSASYEANSWYFPYWCELSWETYHLATLDELGCPIPYGVLLRIKELRDLKFFNCFLAIAPEKLLRKTPKPVDPVVVATLFHGQFVTGYGDLHIPDNYDLALFFVAKW